MLHFYDNLDGQILLSSIQLNPVYRSLCHLLPTNIMDDLAPPDAGIIALIKYWFGIFLYQWLREYENIDCWEGTTTASERRILITHFLARVWGKV